MQPVSLEPVRPNLSLGDFQEGSESIEARGQVQPSLWLKIRSLLSLFNLLAAGILLVYAYFFFKGLSPYWFNPEWTTDDALQQVFPLHEALEPGVFKGDLIYETMKGYLAPVHYWLSYFLTKLTGNPIMAAHWLMLLQVSLTLLFLFLLVRSQTALAPAFLAVAWLLHTRPFMQRMTGGLPRGWAPLIILAFLYFLFKRKHKSVLLVLLIGCLSHPPATLIAAATYGLYLLQAVLRPNTRKNFIKPFLALVLLSPCYAFLTYSVVKRPPETGQMVTQAQAKEMPELQRPHGRFPFFTT